MRRAGGSLLLLLLLLRDEDACSALSHHAIKHRLLGLPTTCTAIRKKRVL